MKKSATAELLTKDEAGLRQEIAELQRTHFNLRMQKGTQQLTDLSQMRTTRRSIARAKTILVQKIALNSQTTK